MNEAFRKFAHRCSQFAGQPITFGVSVIIIAVWAVLGPRFHYSDTWQLIINTSTTIVTFLMVFLIQNTQNRDSRSLHLKVDELIRANKNARNMMINIEEATDKELDDIHRELCKLNQVTEAQIENIEKQKDHRKKRQNKK